MDMQLYLIFGCFTIACAFFSYKRGHSDGFNEGSIFTMDTTLKTLANSGVISLSKDKHGETLIQPVEHFYEDDE